MAQNQSDALSLYLSKAIDLSSQNKTGGQYNWLRLIIKGFFSRKYHHICYITSIYEQYTCGVRHTTHVSGDLDDETHFVYTAGKRPLFVQHKAISIVTAHIEYIVYTNDAKCGFHIIRRICVDKIVSRWCCCAAVDHYSLTDRSMVGFVDDKENIKQTRRARATRQHFI